MPSSQAAPIILSDRQRTLLKQIVRRTTNCHRLVRRAQLLLAAADGASNTQLAQQLQLDRGQVRLWRERWLAATEQLSAAEVEAVSDRKLIALIIKLLSDCTRSGTPNFFVRIQVRGLGIRDFRLRTLMFDSIEMPVAKAKVSAAFATVQSSTLATQTT